MGMFDNPFDAAANVMTFGTYGAAKDATGEGGLDLGNMLGTKNNFQAQMAPGTLDSLKSSQLSYNNNLGQQQAYINALQAMAAGQGANPAQAMLNQATNQGIQQNTGMIASQKGISSPLAVRQASMNAANMNQQAAGQGATMNAQQQVNAQGMLGQQLSSVGNLALNQQNIAQQGFYAPQNINAGVAAGNAANNAAMVGGVAKGAATAMMAAHGGMIPEMRADGGMIGTEALDPMSGAQQFFNKQMSEAVPAQASPMPMPMPKMSAGGHVPGVAPVPGDSYANDTVPVILSPKEIVIPRSITLGKNPGEEAKKFVEAELAKHGGGTPKKAFAEGGEVVPDYLKPTAIQDLDAAKAINSGITAAKMGNDISNAPSRADLFNQQVQDYGVKNGIDLSNPELKRGVEEQVLGQFKTQDVDKQWQDQDSQKIAMHEAEKAKVLGNMSAPTSSEPAMPNMGAPQGAGQPQAKPDMFGNQGYMEGMQKSLGMQQAGLAQEAQAQGDLAKTQANLIGQQTAQLEKDHQAYEQTRQKLTDEIDQTVKAFSENKIDPKHYWNSQGTGQKISSVVGLIMGGLGAGLTHTENPALQFMNAQIDRDINGQKAEMDKKQNLMTYNMHRLNNERDAMAMTKAMHLQTFQNQLAQAQAQAQDPIIKGRLMQAMAPIEAQKAQLVQQVSMRQALLGGGSNQQSQMAPEQKIRGLEMSNMIPAGQSKAYYDELKEAQEGVKARDNVLGAFEKIKKMNTIGGRISSPLSGRAIDAIKQPITASLSKATAGKFTEQDAKMLDTLWPEPGDPDSVVKEKETAIKHLIGEKMNYPMLKSIGIDPLTTGRYGGANSAKTITLGPPKL